MKSGQSKLEKKGRHATQLKAAVAVVKEQNQSQSVRLRITMGVFILDKTIVLHPLGLRTSSEKPTRGNSEDT
jgi:hypothetical protein